MVLGQRSRARFLRTAFRTLRWTLAGCFRISSLSFSLFPSQSSRFAIKFLHERCAPLDLSQFRSLSFFSAPRPARFRYHQGHRFGWVAKPHLFLQLASQSVGHLHPDHMAPKSNRDKILAGYPTKLAKNPPFHSVRSRLGKDTNIGLADPDRATLDRACG